MRRAGPILIALVGVLALVLDFWPNLTLPAFTTEGGSRRIETKLGLDLQGGAQVILTPKTESGKIKKRELL